MISERALLIWIDRVKKMLYPEPVDFAIDKIQMRLVVVGHTTYYINIGSDTDA